MENNTFTILPMSQRFALEPGQTYKGKLSIVNPSDATEDFPYRTSIMPYNVVGSDYTADLSTQYNRSMITEWITIEEPTGVVKPNETKELEFTITVPGESPHPFNPETLSCLNSAKYCWNSSKYLAS